MTHASYRYGLVGAYALDDVDLRVEPGEVVGLLGENGAGKTTLLRLCAGLMRPAAGCVRVNGAEQSPAIRGHVAYAPDEGGTYPFLNVAEAGRFFAALLPWWDAGRWHELVELLDLPLSRPAGQLSKGQRARLRLAQALAQRRPVLLLDEPLAGIDPASRERIVRALAADLAAAPRTVLLSTHEVDEVEGLLDRVVILSGGRVAVDAPADELRARSGGSVERYLREGARA